MDNQRQIAFRAFSELLSYPTETYLEAAELLYVFLQADQPEAAKAVARFGEYVEPRQLHDLEETFARTFDINPACALEIGWHLFGEEYARGSLLVRLRNEMRTHGIEESSELPDHIAHVLSLLAVMEPGAAQAFVHACVLPAVLKMHKALDSADSEYCHVVRCLMLVLEDAYGEIDSAAFEESEATRVPPSINKPPEGDPLRDYPMPCGSQQPAELFQIQLNAHGPSTEDVSVGNVSNEDAEPSAEVSQSADGDPHSCAQHQGPCQGGCNG